MEVSTAGEEKWNPRLTAGTTPFFERRTMLVGAAPRKISAAPQNSGVDAVNVDYARRNFSAARGKFKADLRSRNPAILNSEAARENFNSAFGNSSSAPQNFNAALGTFGLPECSAESFFRIATLFFRRADSSNEDSEFSMRISDFFQASAGLLVCIAEFFFPMAGLAK